MMLRFPSSIRRVVTVDTRAIDGLVSNRMTKASIRISAGRVLSRNSLTVTSRT